MRYDITAKISVVIPRELGAVTLDEAADFEGIYLRISNLRNKAVNVRVSDLGDSVTVECVTFGAFGGISSGKVKNESSNGKALEDIIARFLA